MTKRQADKSQLATKTIVERIVDKDQRLKEAQTYHLKERNSTVGDALKKFRKSLDEGNG
jgi:hypothetical protein